ncbi:LanC-like protein 3-like protein [Gryllus bimaculatus]|nr:LanC-like protein 3-like protein [Gryllus bimaculatus]
MLLLFRLTRDRKFLHRAQEMARFMFTRKFDKEARVPDNPFSLFEGLPPNVYLALQLLFKEDCP